MGLVIFFGVIAVMALIVAYLYKQQRIKDMTALASRMSMRFDQEDPFDLVAIPFKLFSMGDGHGCENVLSGTLDGMETRIFDFWYYEESTNDRGGKSRDYERFSCCVTTIPAACAQLMLTRETLITRLGSAVGIRDIEFESEEFNRAFRVKADDRQFASAFIDSRMMEWLLTVKGWSFEVIDRYAIVYGRKMPASKLPILPQILRGFVEHVPAVVPSLYPLSN